MKFDYDKTEEEERGCVAFLSHMEDKPNKIILCIRNTDQVSPKNMDAAMWLYYDGTTQLNTWQPEIATKKFYKGDTITITF